MNALHRATRGSHPKARLLACALILVLTGTGLTATQLTAALAAARPDQKAIDVREESRDIQIPDTTVTNTGYGGQNGADPVIAIAGGSSVVASDTGSNAQLDALQVQPLLTGWGRSTASGSTPTPSASPTPTPTSPPTTTSASSVTVSTSAQLTAALEAAVPGQTIVMTSGTYVGKFVAATPGTASQPITLTGPASAVLTTGSNTSGYGLHVTGSNWRLTGFSVSVAQKGIVLDRSSNTVIDGVDVGKIGQEAIHVRTNSVDVIIRNSRVHDTGLSTASYGEGIYVGSAKSNWSSIMGSSSTPDRSDRVLIENNTIVNTTAEGIDIKEGTTGGIVRGNSFTHSGHSGANYADSWVDVKGNGYLLESNSGSDTLLDAFQVHSVMTGWGGGNVFRSNTVIDGVPGYEVRVSSSEPGNTVICASSNADLGLTNITCT